MKPQDSTRLTQERKLRKRYENGYRRIIENVQELKAIEKAGLETLTPVEDIIQKRTGIAYKTQQKTRPQI